MLPIFALVGRPNVGKSTLFNRLTKSRDAIVDDMPGVTRDRLYAHGRAGGKSFLAVDTGGIDLGGGALSALILKQVEAALDQAQAILFMVDARDGLVAQDREVGALLRRRGARVFVLVNKSEGVAPAAAEAEFQELGLGAPLAISAKRGDGIDALLELALAEYAPQQQMGAPQIPTIALAGRPNVGKSTLANRLIGESRMLVSDTPGTTRDSVRAVLCVGDVTVHLIDTAGMRRKARVAETLEKFSVLKALQAMDEAQVVLLLLDASGEVGAQDAAIAGLLRDLGRSMVLVVNKWDCLSARQREKIRGELSRKLPFLPNPERVFISALHGANLAAVLPAAMRAYRSATADLATSGLNRVLANALAHTPPPMHQRRPVRLKFAHQSGKNPPCIVVHGSRAEKLTPSYRRYLANYFARAYELRGTPVRIIPRSGENPYRNKASGRRRKA
ncbi:MAG: ribosome biogenesis GTPase Der [Gammaproteobacteria bacterium]